MTTMMLTKPEEKRLSALQVAYAKPIDAWGDERLTVRDFLLLLNHDGSVRQLIKEIVQDKTVDSPSDQHDDPDLDEVPEKPTPIPASAITPKRPAPAQVVVVQKPDVLRTDLVPELQLLHLVNNDPELARAWLGEEQESEGRQLVRLVAVASQWNQILLLWDRLAERCRQAQRKATHDELSILGNSLDLHNLIWDGKAAEMQHANLGDSFDYDYHERGRSTGDDVRGEWLPGLISAAGMRQRKILVAT